MVTNWHAMSMVYGISGILTGSRISICCGIDSRISASVTPCPPETAQDQARSSRKEEIP